MEQDKFFLERKYVKFIKNIKLSLNKAISSGNMELVDTINEYLATIEKLKKVYVLKEKNDVRTYSDDARMYRKKLEDLQKKILYIQYNNPSSTFTNNNLVIDVPKFKNDDINYIFMFIYKFIKINNKSICIILKNFIDDLFNLNITEIKYKKEDTINIDFQQICSSKILDNITIVYDNRVKKVKYIYKPVSPPTSNQVPYINSKKVLNTLVDKINDFDINTFFNKKETKTLNKLVESNDNTIDDSSNIIYEKPPRNILINENVDLSFNKKSNKELKITLAILLINMLKNIHCDIKNKLSKNELKSQICKYLTLNPKFNIEKEYNLLYNYFLTRDLQGEKTETQKKESNINIVIPEFSLSLVNNIVILFYIYIKDNKDDICKNILIFLKNIKNELVKKTYSSFDDGSYFNSINKILSVCSNSSRAEHLINTFYLKYKEYDKILISNLLLKIIENDSLKIKYDVVEDKFSVVIVNQKTLNIDFTQIDKTKLLEGLNNDLKCINESINKDLIIKLIDFIRDSLNNIISIVSDVEILTSIFNLSTDSNRIYGYLKNTKTNFKIRKLLVILLIKFLVIHISKFYLDPNSSKFNMYDSLVNDIYKHICEKLTVDFSYNIYRKMEHLYQDFPNYEIN